MDTQSNCCVGLGGLSLPQANNSGEWGFSSCCNEKTLIMFYLGCQPVYRIAVVVYECIVTICNRSCLAFQTWNINNFLWVAGIQFVLQYLSYGLIQLYLLRSGRKLLFNGMTVILWCIGWLLKVLLTGRKVICVTGKTLNVCSPFRLLFCTASKKMIKRKHDKRKKSEA